MQLKPSFKIAALAFVVICIPDLSRLYKTAELASRSQETRSNNMQPLRYSDTRHCRLTS